MNLPFLQNNRLFWAFLLVLGLAVVGQAQTNPPQIITEPKSQSVAIGQEVTIDVEATGTEPLFYRWAFNGQYFGPPSKKSAFTIKKTDESSYGEYAVTVSNLYGETYSDVIEVKKLIRVLLKSLGV